MYKITRLSNSYLSRLDDMKQVLKKYVCANGIVEQNIKYKFCDFFILSKCKIWRRLNEASSFVTQDPALQTNLKSCLTGFPCLRFGKEVVNELNVIQTWPEGKMLHPFATCEVYY